MPGSVHFATDALARGEPPVPRSFRWRGTTLEVAEIVRSWRSTHLDRGDAYLARHWYEFRLADDARAVVYFDRRARRASPRWWLYTLDPGDG